MNVIFLEKDRQGLPIGGPLVLCERHARDHAVTLKARWPERHEVSESTWDATHRWRTEIHVKRNGMEPCEWCAVEHEPFKAHLDFPTSGV
jgi:hypothetical protein